MSEIEPRWHSLNRDQWESLFNKMRWRDRVATTLREVASSPDALHQDRLAALQTLNVAIMDGKLAPDLGYPEFLRDVLLELTNGARRGRWFGRKRRQAELHARLVSAQWVLGTVGEFPEPGRTTQPDVAAQQVDESRFS